MHVFNANVFFVWENFCFLLLTLFFKSSAKHLLCISCVKYLFFSSPTFWDAGPFFVFWLFFSNSGALALALTLAQCCILHLCKLTSCSSAPAAMVFALLSGHPSYMYINILFSNLNLYFGDCFCLWGIPISQTLAPISSDCQTLTGSGVIYL